jgi:hypothetical protein
MKSIGTERLIVRRFTSGDPMPAWLRATRKRFFQSRSASAQVVPLLDQGIFILENDQAVTMAGLEVLDDWGPKSYHAGFCSLNSLIY